MFTRFVMLCVLGLAVGLFVGCGDGGQSGQETTQASEGTKPDGPVMEGGTIKIDESHPEVKKAGESAVPKDN